MDSKIMIIDCYLNGDGIRHRINFKIQHFSSLNVNNVILKVNKKQYSTQILNMLGWHEYLFKST